MSNRGDGPPEDLSHLQGEKRFLFYALNACMAGNAFPLKSNKAWFSHWQPELGLVGSQPLPFTAVQVGPP